MKFIGFDGEAKQVYVADAVDADEARDAMAEAKGTGDGDEFSVVPISDVPKGTAILVKGLT